jgi:hypothetical protein
VVATVAQQSDYMKRVRGNGGSRTRLRPEGILLLGDSQAHRAIAVSLGLPKPEKGETVSVRVVKAEPTGDHRTVLISGHHWRVARTDNPVASAPQLPNPRASAESTILEQVFETATGVDA